MKLDDTNAFLYIIVNECKVIIIDMNEKEKVNEIKLGTFEITDLVI